MAFWHAQLQARKSELAAAAKAASAIGPLRAALDAARAELRAMQRARGAQQRETAEPRAGGGKPSNSDGRVAAGGAARARELEACLEERERRLRELCAEVGPGTPCSAPGRIYVRW